MKKVQLIINIALIAGILGLGGYQLLKNEKTVYVDIGKLMQEYRGMKDAQAGFQKKSAQWQASVDTLVAGFQQELKDYEKERSGMNFKEKELKEQILRNRQQQIGQYQAAIKNKISEEDSKTSSEVIEYVNKTIFNYGKEKGYTFIFGANGTGSLLYASDKRDITLEILQLLNLEYEKQHK